MVDGIPVKVECESCHSHHKFRRAEEDRAADKRTRSTSSTTSKSSSTRERTTSSKAAGARAAADAIDEANREKIWQQRIAGKMADEFVRYTPNGKFEADTLVNHTKFGDGFVVRVVDTYKIEVMFRDGPKLLAQGLE